MKIILVEFSTRKIKIVIMQEELEGTIRDQLKDIINTVDDLLQVRVDN